MRPCESTGMRHSVIECTEPSGKDHQDDRERFRSAPHAVLRKMPIRNWRFAADARGRCGKVIAAHSKLTGSTRLEQRETPYRMLKMASQQGRRELCD
jgi:hypothetical protein